MMVILPSHWFEVLFADLGVVRSKSFACCTMKSIKSLNLGALRVLMLCLSHYLEVIKSNFSASIKMIRVSR